VDYLNKCENGGFGLWTSVVVVVVQIVVESQKEFPPNCRMNECVEEKI
jgi:hypothetical protein